MEEAPSRAERRNNSNDRRRKLLLGIGGGVLALAIVALIIVLVTGGGGNGKEEAKHKGTPPVPGTTLTLTLGNVSVESAGPPAQLTPEQSQAVLMVIRDYLTIATVDPLRKSQPAGDLTGVFDPPALATVTGADRAVMLDEGLPKVTGTLEVVGQPVGIVALADQTGAIVLATAHIDVAITGVTNVKGDPLRITRGGDFVLVPTQFGVWKVTAYSMLVARKGAGLDPTTTTVATTATTKKKGSK